MHLGLCGNVDEDEPLAVPEMPPPPQGEVLDKNDDKPAPLLSIPAAAPVLVVPPVTPPPRAPSPIGIGACLQSGITRDLVTGGNSVCHM